MILVSKRMARASGLLEMCEAWRILIGVGARYRQHRPIVEEVKKS